MISQVRSHLRLNGRGLTAARLAWAAAFVLAVGLWAMGSFELARQAPVSCTINPCDPFELTMEDLAIIHELGLPVGALRGFWMLTGTTIGVVFFAIGLLLFVRLRDSWLVLVVSFTLVYLGAVFFTGSDDALWGARPGLRGAMGVVYGLGYGALMLFLFYFPDGTFVPRSRRLQRVALPLILLGAPFTVPAARAQPLAVILFLGSVVLGTAAQFHRYRNVSDALQRQQTKWVVIGFVAALLVMVVWLLANATFPADQPGVGRIYALIGVRTLITLLIPILPLSIAFSILRYRLWDVDLVLNRALVYSVLTALLGGAYFITVVLLQSVFRSLTGQGNTLAIVMSTLAIAAVFMPLRNRIQAEIDRRFFRHRYDMEQALASLHTTIRDKLDIESLSVELLQVVDQTMQPEHVSLWLRARH